MEDLPGLLDKLQFAKNVLLRVVPFCDLAFQVGRGLVLGC